MEDNNNPIVSYQMDPENANEVIRVEKARNYEARARCGYYKKVCAELTADGRRYYHGVMDLADGQYQKDPGNTEPIEINGVVYALDGDGAVFVPNTLPPPEVSMRNLACLVSELEAKLIVAGVV